MQPADSLPLQDANAHATTHSSSKIVSDETCFEGSCTEAKREVSHIFSGAKVDSLQRELFDRNSSVPLDQGALPGDNSKTALELESELPPITIWTEPLISSLYQTCGPPSTLILRALTTGITGDVFSLERLEILGDSFLKYAITSSIFFQYRYENEGKLSFMRGLKVSNRQLFYLARQQGLPSYVITRMFSPLVNWLPPGFYYNDGGDTEGSGEGNLLLMSEKGPQEFEDDEEDGSIFAEEGLSGPSEGPCSQGPSGKGHSSDIQLRHNLHLCCSDKAVADATEALVGAYLLCLGPEGAFKFLKWLGVELTKQEETQDDYDASRSSTKDSALGADDLESDSTMNSQDDLKVPFQACQTFDRIFSPSLLVQAFTHTSLPRDYNSVRSSYEQLEFLGDALLDFLVTRHLYLHHRHMPPGELTDLRSAVVNNYSFAALAVQLGFPKHLRSMSPQLFSMVNKFTVKLKEKEMKQQQVESEEIYSSVFLMRNEGDEEGAQVEVPKALGDLFEAVAGTLYVDCGQDLDRVWQVYLPILKPSIDYYSAHPPMSAIRRLLEMMPNAAKFSPVERMVDGKFKSTLTVAGFGKFVATGRNFRIAKSSAAQKALNVIQKTKSETKVDSS
ncbi:hypothetical protein ACROYT_G039966 [Oculina patagonica]